MTDPLILGGTIAILGILISLAIGLHIRPCNRRPTDDLPRGDEG